MKHINQRNIKIVDELMNFCYRQGSKKIDVSISTENNVTSILISADIFGISSTILSDIEKALNAPRCHEMEEYFWSLTGDDDLDNELNLVGMMIDEAFVNYIDSHILNISVKRKH